MKIFNKPQLSKQEKKFNQIGKIHGAIIMVLFASGIAIQLGGNEAGSILVVLGALSVIASFFSGYMRSDEFQKMIQLKAAATSFVIIMIVLSIASMLEAYDKFLDYPVTILFYVGFWIHLLILPHVAKRANEK